MYSKGPHSQNYDFLKQEQEKLDKTSVFHERYAKQIKCACLVFLSAFGFLLLAHLPISLPDSAAYTEAILRNLFMVMAYCCWGHAIAFWLSYKFVPSAAGFVSWASMWIVMPTSVAFQMI